MWNAWECELQFPGKISGFLLICVLTFSSWSLWWFRLRNGFGLAIDGQPSPSYQTMDGWRLCRSRIRIWQWRIVDGGFGSLLLKLASSWLASSLVVWLFWEPPRADRWRWWRWFSPLSRSFFLSVFFSGLFRIQDVFGSPCSLDRHSDMGFDGLCDYNWSLLFPLWLSNRILSRQEVPLQARHHLGWMDDGITRITSKSQHIYTCNELYWSKQTHRQLVSSGKLENVNMGRCHPEESRGWNGSVSLVSS